MKGFLKKIKQKSTHVASGIVKKIKHLKIKKGYKFLIVVILVAAGITGILIFKRSEAQAAWWNYDWGYRKVFNFTNSSTTISSPRKVLVTVDTATLITAGKMQATCDDVRFTDTNGQLLDYFIDTNTSNCNTSTTNFYIKLNTIVAGVNQVYMYYGNASATRNSPGGRKNDFFDTSSLGTLGIGLTNYWNLNETTANTCTGGVNDSCNVAQTYDGAWNDGATYTANGKLNGAVTFDGTSDNIDTGDSISGTAVSFAFWMKPSTNTDSIITKGASRGSATTRNLDIFGNGTDLVWVASNGSSYLWTAQTPFPSLGQWHYVVATWDGTTSANGTKLYLNGVLVDSQTSTGTTLADTFNLYLGGAVNSTFFYTGQLDDVRVYNRSLTNSEISYLYNNGNGREILPNSPVTFTPSAGPTFGSEETTPGPVAYWKMDEGQGQTVFDNSNKNNGTLGANSSASTDDPTWKQESDCLSGKCLQFDGANDYVNMPSTFSNLSGNVNTFSAWVRLNSYDTNGCTLLSTNTGNSVLWQIQNNTTLWFDLNNSVTITPTPFADNQWRHLEMTYDGTTARVYVNGNLVGSNTFARTSLTSGAKNFVMGDWIGGLGTNWSCKGFIDDVKVYPYARTASQVQVDYNQYAERVGQLNQKYLSDGLVAYWKMDEASGNATDSSGNGFTLTNSSVTYTGGKFGNGGSFSGGTLTVADNSTLSVGNNSFTMSTWVKLASKGGEQAIIGKYSTASQREYLLEYASANDRFIFYVCQTGTVCTIVSANSLGSPTTGTWYFITTWYDKTAGTINIQVNNGGVDSAAQTSGAFDSTASFVIGRLASNEIALSGNVDDTRMYNRALSGDERANLYNWAPGPVGYWPMDEGSANTCAGGTNDSCDSSGYGNDGAWNGNTTVNNKGKYGKATVYDGNGDYTLVNDSNSLDLTTGLSLEAWVYPTSFSCSNTFCQIIMKNSGNSLYYGILTNGTGNIGCQISGVSGGVFGSTLSLNQWSHVVCTHDGSSLKLYVNGRLDTSSALTGGSTASNANLSIGTDLVNNRSFIGSIDEVKIYNYARNSQQVTEDMNGGHPTGGSPIGSPLAYWSFDEQQGQTVNNRVSSSYAGTLGATSASSSDDPIWKTRENCKVNGCLSFDGTNRYAKITPSPTISSSIATISAWVYPTSSSADSYIVDSGTSDNQFSLIWYPTNNTYKGFAAHFGTGTTWATSTAVATINTWHHVIATADGSTLKLYVDGKLVNSVAEDTATTSTVWEIGSNGASGGFNGFIDEVKIYNFSLTADQVRIDMNNGSSESISVLGNSEASDLTDGAGNPPTLEWKLDEKTGTTVNDTSGNGLSGTFTNTPNWLSSGNCKEGACLSFDSADSDRVVSSSNLGISGGTARTVSFWIYPTSSSGRQTIVNWGANGTSTQFWIEYNGLVGGAQTIFIGGNNNDMYTTATLPLNQWSHVEFTYSGGEFFNNSKIYYNGIQQTLLDSAGTGTLNTTNSTVSLGYDHVLNRQPFQGRIDGLKIYNYARTGSQVAYDYNRGKPVGWWKMDECQGSTANNSSGGGFNGTIAITGQSIGTCSTPSTAWGTGATGKFGSSLNLDGGGDYITVPNTSGELTTYNRNRSVSVWFKADDLSSQRGIMSVGNNDADGSPIWLLVVRSNARLSIYHGGNYRDGTTPLTAGTWYHVVYTFDSTSNAVKLYLNGKLELSTTVGDSNVNAGNLYIGTGYPTQFDGLIDDARIYNYTLSANQVKTIMNEGSSVRFGQ